MNKIAVLDNRVFKILSQSSPKAAIDLLGMRVATQFNSKYTEFMITETEAYSTSRRDSMSMMNTFSNKMPESLVKGPPYVSILKTYGDNYGIYILAGKKGTTECILIRSGKILLGKPTMEVRRKKKIKSDYVVGPGNVSQALGIKSTHDMSNLFDGPIFLLPRIHVLNQAIAKQRKNSKTKNDKFWRYTLSR
jgi:3-methyladenine DNA glycosylase Mpg